MRHDSSGKGYPKQDEFGSLLRFKSVNPSYRFLNPARQFRMRSAGKDIFIFALLRFEECFSLSLFLRFCISTFLMFSDYATGTSLRIFVSYI